MPGAAVATIVANGREVLVYEPQTPSSWRRLVALARTADIGVVVPAQAQPTVERVIAAGVCALFPAPPTVSELTIAARAIETRGAYVHPDFAPTLLRIARWALRPESVLDALTVREREVLQLLAGGHTNRAIAGQLFVSEHTVRNHLARIYRKLDVTTRTEAVAMTSGAFRDVSSGGDDERRPSSD